MTSELQDSTLHSRPLSYFTSGLVQFVHVYWGLTYKYEICQVYEPWEYFPDSKDSLQRVTPAYTFLHRNVLTNMISCKPKFLKICKNASEVIQNWMYWQSYDKIKFFHCCFFCVSSFSLVLFCSDLILLTGTILLCGQRPFDLPR